VEGRVVKRWFLPDSPDVLGMLREQAATTVSGIDFFAAWSAGDAGAATDVRNAEHAADTQRRALQLVLREAFSTPLDPEDIFELSERLDTVLNDAKNAVREAEVMELGPDAALAAMGKHIADGVHHIADAYEVLTVDSERAIASADAAIKCERAVEHEYRAAMSRLVAEPDLRAVITWREMYRRYARTAEALVEVANRIWYAVIKEG
jgi:uncharacterized protein Yka (UPF0111/DUF47 family)